MVAPPAPRLQPLLVVPSLAWAFVAAAVAPAALALSVLYWAYAYSTARVLELCAFEARYAEMPARVARVEAEIGALGPDHPWAGAYSLSAGYSAERLWIAPRSGCVLLISGCGGRDVDFGTVREDGDRLLLSFPPRREGEFGMQHRDVLRIMRRTDGSRLGVGDGDLDWAFERVDSE